MQIEQSSIARSTIGGTVAVRRKVWPGRVSGRKRGDMSIVSVILGVIFIIFMIKAAPFLYTLLTSKSDIEKCRASVSVKSISIDSASILTGGKRLSDPLQLDLACHTRLLVAKKEGVYDGNKIYFGNYRPADFNDARFVDQDLPDKLKTAVADRMLDCWDMFGKGEIDPFSKLGGDIHCIECYEFVFSNETKKEVQDKDKKGAPVLSDFTGFLASSYADNKQTTTYAQYLYKSNEVKGQVYDLNMSKQQGIVYYRGTFELADGLAKGTLGLSTAGGCFIGAKVGLVGGSFFGPVGTVVGGVVGGGVGCVGGLVLGITAADKASGIGKTIGVAIVPVENLGEKCGKLY
ncbi:hypothetical protein HYV83_05050 [Candidatus Woesearchaeota archaeon]|nr:hypothetical protein [Candidatus Woesearchaeota archaeon]